VFQRQRGKALTEPKLRVVASGKAARRGRSGLVLVVVVATRRLILVGRVRCALVKKETNARSVSNKEWLEPVNQ
jgi:hypothetical protein